MFEYFFVYICLWGLALAHSLSEKNFGKKIFLIQGVLLTGFSALRFETGYDWPVYRTHYQNDGFITAFIFEPGYELLVSIFVRAGVDFNYYLSILSIFMVVGMMYIIKRLIPDHKEIAIAAAFSIPELFLIPVFSVIRQTLSLLILLFGFLMVKNGKKSIGLLNLLVSFLFHYSTIFIFGIVLLIRYVNLRERTYWILFAIAGVFYLASFDAFGYFLKSIVELFIPSYSYYFGKDTFNASIIYRIVILIVTGLMIKLVVMMPQRGHSESNYNGKFGKVTSLLSLLLPILLYNFPTFTSRFFFLGAFFIGAVSLRNLTFQLRLTRPLICAVLSLLLLLPFYRFLSSPFSSPYIPYQSMLIYDERTSTGGERTQELLDMLDSLW